MRSKTDKGFSFAIIVIVMLVTSFVVMACIVIANADFDVSDCYGSITSSDGVVWAEYSSGFMFNDYTVRIHEECELSDEVVLMLMASYKSDRITDSN